jgi:hypothetical protein
LLSQHDIQEKVRYTSSHQSCLSFLLKLSNYISVHLFSLKIIVLGQVWWCVPVIPALRRLRQKNCEFEASLDYTVRPCLKKSNQASKNTQTYSVEDSLVLPSQTLKSLETGFHLLTIMEIVTSHYDPNLWAEYAAK